MLLQNVTVQAIKHLLTTIIAGHQYTISARAMCGSGAPSRLSAYDQVINRLLTTPEMTKYACKLGIVSCCRRRPYTADSHVLEFAFYKHFEDMHSARGMTFGLNQQSGLGVDSYKAKLQFIRAMSDRKLVSWCLCCMNTFPSL